MGVTRLVSMVGGSLGREVETAPPKGEGEDEIWQGQGVFWVVADDEAALKEF